MLTGNDNSRAETHCSSMRGATTDISTELVSWIPLLNTLHDESLPRSAGIKLERDHSTPGIRLVERSWDLMPPEVVRPFATSTLHDIAVLACRMGVKWKDFKPTDGIMEGEGLDNVFSATKVRGLGTVLSYSRLLSDEKITIQHDADEKHGETATNLRRMSLSAMQRDEEANHIAVSARSSTSHEHKPSLVSRYIWSHRADRFWFGIIPGNSDLGLLDYRVGSAEDIHATLWQLDSEGKAVKSLKQMQSYQPGYLHGFADIIPLASAWLRQPGTTENWYPRPTNGTLGLTWYHAAFHAFRHRLEHLIDDRATRNPGQLDWVRTQYTELNGRFGKEWDGISSDLDARDVEYYDALQTIYDATTKYFLDIKEHLAYTDLLVAHIREAPRSLQDAEYAIRNGKAEEPSYSDAKRWRAEAMVFYFKYIPDYKDYMKYSAKLYCGDGELVEDAWVTMIFRAFLWMRAHIPKEDVSILPSRYYKSRLPVYIT